MLRGIDANPIVVGAYVDHASGGICPMLAAHRNGGRTSLASFARAWDRYTGAKRPRLATRREVRTLRALLVSSLAGDLDPASGSIADAAAQIRAERAELVARERAPGGSGSDPGQDARDGSIEDMGERQRAAELRARLRWAWMRPARRYDHFKDPSRPRRSSSPNGVRRISSATASLGRQRPDPARPRAPARAG
ncbi:MAG TPA: hypothetical protein VE997_00285 [Candidatus Limnocylindria bacterium]|nr:hypothetical protein [Candidatus Limnocylindria bacterium]